MHNVCLCTSAAIGHHLTASVAFANAQQQQPVSAAADDRFPQPAGAELTIELATREAPAGWPLDERLATLAIARAPAANPQNVGSRSPPAEAVSALLFARSRTRSPAGHGNRRGGGVAPPALAFAQMRAPECRSAARLLRTTSRSGGQDFCFSTKAALCAASTMLKAHPAGGHAITGSSPRFARQPM
jgi:hypothetical protein